MKRKRRECFETQQWDWMEMIGVIYELIFQQLQKHLLESLYPAGDKINLAMKICELFNSLKSLMNIKLPYIPYI